MSHRRFVDRSGRRWEVRIRAKGDWQFRPVPGNPEPEHHGEPPHWARDPFEMSEQELQTLLADATPVDRPGGAPSPFRDAGGSKTQEAGGSLFSDYEPPTKPKSPFLDDRDD